jgi:hypothetical protein
VGVGQAGEQRAAQHTEVAEPALRQAHHHADPRQQGRQQQRLARPQRAPLGRQGGGGVARQQPGHQQGGEGTGQGHRHPGAQQTRCDRAEHQQGLQPGGGGGQDGRRGQRALRRWRATACQRAQAGHGGGAGDEAAQQPGAAQPGLRPEPAQRHMGQGLQQQEHEHQPTELTWAAAAQPGQRRGGQQRQHQQGQRAQQQAIVQLLLAQHTSREMVHALARRQQGGEQQRSNGRPELFARGQRADQEDRQQRQLGGQSRVAAGAPHAAGGQQQRNAQQAGAQQPAAVEPGRQRAGQRGDRKAAQPGHLALRALALAPLALQPDQEAAAQRHGQALEQFKVHSRRCCSAGSWLRHCARRAGSSSPNTSPSPSGRQSSTWPQGSTSMVWPQVRRPLACRPPWAGAST